MSMKKLLNLMMIILLLAVAGCLSDDNEGTFESPTNIISGGGSTESTTDSTGATDLTGTADNSFAIRINGTAAGIRILEPATVYAINGAGFFVSSTVNSDGSFHLSGQSMTAPYLLLLVPHHATGLNWQGDLQSRIIVNNSSENLAVNPIFTAIALSVFNENSFDLFVFVQSLIENSAISSELLETFNTILKNTNEEKLDAVLNEIVESWGKTSTGNNIFTSSLFFSTNYRPRKSMQGSASYDHLFIEALSVKFGVSNLAQSLINNVNSSSIDGPNLLSDKGFQEGLVFTIYSLNKYQPFISVSAFSVFENYLTFSGMTEKKYLQPFTKGGLYIEKIEVIVDQLIEEENKFNKSENEIKAKIKSIIATQDILY